MNQTFLYEEHLKLNAKMVEFAGFKMPLQYTSLIDEHHKVRNACGLFDISHMGLFEVHGEKELDFLSTNYLPDQAMSSTYTTFCDEKGGCLDDLILYRWSKDRFWVIGNASNRSKDLEHLKKHTKVNFLSDKYGILALQGPDSVHHLGLDLKKNQFIQKNNLVFATTGYTGELGFECIGPFDELKNLFLTLLSKGVSPCGLGCRDSLRLEMGYALYGHELSSEISPAESIASWAVKKDKDFFGKDNCLKRAERRPYALKLLEKGVPREGYPIFKNNVRIGIVTSGTFSPSIQEGIALMLSDQTLQKEDLIEVSIREKKVPAVITSLPFYRKRS